jgi:cysteine synthase
VENTSGNFGASLAFWAPHFDIKNVMLYIPNDLASGKTDTLRRYGVGMTVINRDDTIGGIVRAIELGKTPGHFCPDQYGNWINPYSHYVHTAPMIDELTKGKARTIFVAFGTGGTGGGFSRFGREKYGEDGYTVFGVICAPKAEIPGARSRERLKQIKFPWETFARKFIEVDTYNAYRISKILDSNGFPAGPSSGMAYWGFLKFFADVIASSGLDKYRNNEDGKVHIAIPFPDDAKNYSDKYPTILRYEHLGSCKIIEPPVFEDYQI